LTLVNYPQLSLKTNDFLCSSLPLIIDTLCAKVQFIDADADADADASICLGNEFRDYSPLILEMSWFGLVFSVFFVVI